MVSSIQVRLMLSAGTAEIETFNLNTPATLGTLLDAYSERFGRAIDVNKFAFRCQGIALNPSSQLAAGDFITACPSKPDGGK